MSSELPSATIPYNFKGIEVSKLKPKHLIDFSEAIVLESLEPVISAVGETIDVDVNELTFGDFYYILMHHRFNSRQLPMRADWACTGEVYKSGNNTYTMADIQAMVQQYDEAEDKDDLINPYEIPVDAAACNYPNRFELQLSDFEITRLESPIDDPRFDFPRVRILSQYAETQNNPRLEKIAQIAAWVKEGDTIHDKIRVLSDQDDFEMFDAAEAMRQRFDHGVNRKLVKHCRSCGQPHEIGVFIGPQSFF